MMLIWKTTLLCCRSVVCFQSVLGRRFTRALITALCCSALLTFQHTVPKSVAQSVVRPVTERGIATIASSTGVETDVLLPIVDEVSLNLTPFCQQDCFRIGSEEPQSLALVKNRWGCTETVSIRPEDEIWIVSSRNIGSGANLGGQLEVQRLGDCQWQPSSLPALASCHRSNRSLTTLMYVHGNQTDYQFGISRGIQFYHNLVTSQKAVSPLRMVLWLWKSERELARLYPDFRIKSQRAVKTGQAFKTTLEQLGDARVLLAGFSLGTQVILSALEAMEAEQGASPCDSTAPWWAAGVSDRCSCDKYRIALIAPAVDPAYACRIANRMIHSTLTQRTAVFLNRSDRAVKALRIIVRRECHEKPVSLDRLLDGRRLPLGQTQKIDLTWETGVRHSIVKYSSAPSFCRELHHLLNEFAADGITEDEIAANRAVPLSPICVE